MKKLRVGILASGLAGILVLGALWTSVAQAGGGHKHDLVLEVAVNGNLSAFNDTGTDSFRAAVIYARGNIYPEGTLPSGLSDFDPTTQSDLGTWRCHFLLLGDDDFPSLTGMVTYQFQLKPTGYHSGYHHKESTIVVQGLNSHRFDDDTETRALAVVGGTGKYAGVSGEVIEEILGRNESGSVNSRFRFKLQGGKDDHHGGYRHKYKRY